MGVTLSGFLDVPPERLEAVRAALPEHIRLTRGEPGCLRFDVVESASHPGRFAVTEAFRDEAAFEAHQARAAASRWGRVTAGLPRDYAITGMAE